ncbi:MAG TPA: ferritin-like domain-containing protein [Actinomycetota bacterium]
MSTDHYAIPLRSGSVWEIPTGFGTTFQWEYDERRAQLLTLYGKGKQKQWDAEQRIDWSVDVDPRSPDMPEVYVPIYGSDIWEAMDDERRAEVRHHMTAWLNSQFLHGEQGALVCTSKIVMGVPDIDAKFYAATQVMDEARHVEVYDRYLRTKIEMAYPINPFLQELLDQVIRDARWDLTYLGMQIMIEGLALAAFALIRDYTAEPLAKQINTYVMQDEARHVAFGRLALRDYYPELTQAERGEREEFVAEASRLMYGRLMAREVWDNLGIGWKNVREHVESSEILANFRRMLFSRIVPTVKDIGLWGERVQRCFADLGVIDFQDAVPDDLLVADELIAEEYDARRGEVESAIARGAVS